MSDQPVSSPCTVFGPDDRKSAAVAQAGGGGAQMRLVRDFAEARALLRNSDARQAGFLADLVNKVSLTRAPILYQHGAEHRRQRGATARFFAPRVVTTAYRALMERTSDELVDRLRKAGRANLDELGLEMAVTIAAEIVGLTDSDSGGMARRLGALVTGMPQGGSRLAMILGLARGQARSLNFFLRDVKPAIASRREQRREDVISHLLDEDHSEREILTECLTYGAAGMITTREFITMAGWHLLENNALRGRFLDGDEASQIAILEEILRLEPVVGMLFRRIDTETAASRSTCAERMPTKRRSADARIGLIRTVRPRTRSAGPGSPSVTGSIAVPARRSRSRRRSSFSIGCCACLASGSREHRTSAGTR
jgi:cytochrome P450